MIKKIQGVIISETPYKESSKIVNIMTNEGIIGVIAKGCKNIKSPLRVITNKLSFNEFVIYYHDNSLSTLKEGTVINYFDNIKKDLTLNSYMIYLTDLTKQVISEGDTAKIFDDYINTLIKINDGLNPLILTNILELKYLDYLGAPINFKSCVKCGNTNDIITISSIEGGYICKNCHTNQVIYDNKVLQMLKMYYLVDIKTISDLKISENVINNINDFINDYYESYTGVYIKSKEFLNKIIEY